METQLKCAFVTLKSDGSAVGNVKRVFDFKEEIRTLMEGKGKAIAQLNDGKWTCEFVFVAHVTTHCNDLTL